MPKVEAEETSEGIVESYKKHKRLLHKGII